MNKSQTILFIVTSLLTVIIIDLSAVEVSSSLCPTNKIAPHRRAVSSEGPTKGRTIGLVYSLLTPSRPRPPYINNLTDLQEQPQEDDPDDCGDIDDYDETDLSSITPGAHNKIQKKQDRVQHIPSYYPGRTWDWLPYWPQPTSKPQRPNPYPQKPQRPTPHPQKPQRPTPNVKPPFGSGGIFESHVYRPPPHYNPSDFIKPVYEYTIDRPPKGYSPSFVGGISGQVAGYPTVRPSPASERITLQKRPSKSAIRFPDSDSYNRRDTRARPSNVAADVIESFLHLLLN